MEVGILVLALLLGLIPGAIAQSKGHAFLSWWIFGALLFIVALPLSLTLKPQVRSDEQICAACRSAISAAATICAHCRTPVEPGNTVMAPAQAPVKTDWRILGITGGLVGLLLIVVVIANVTA